MPSEIFAPEILVEIKAAKERGLSTKDIASRLQVTPAHVANALMLADAPNEIHDAIERGELSPTSAVPLLRMSDPIAALGEARLVASRRGSEKIRFSDVQAVTKPDPMREALRACLSALRAAGLGESEAAKKAVAALN